MEDLKSLLKDFGNVQITDAQWRWILLFGFQQNTIKNCNIANIILTFARTAIFIRTNYVLYETKIKTVM